MKKVLCLMLILLVALSGVSAMAYTQDVTKSDTITLKLTVSQSYSWTIPPEMLEMETETEEPVAWMVDSQQTGVAITNNTILPNQQITIYVATRNGFKMKLETATDPLTYSEEYYADYDLYIPQDDQKIKVSSITPVDLSAEKGPSVAYPLLTVAGMSPDATVPFWYQIPSLEYATADGYYTDQLTFYSLTSVILPD